MQRLWSFLGFTEDEAEVAGDDEARRVEDGRRPEDAGRQRDAWRPADAMRRRSPVFSLHTNRPMEIVVLEPRSFDEARAGADHLKSRRPVIVNLKDADRDLAKRIVDFTCGVTYAVDGQMQRIGDEIFLFTPTSVTVLAEGAAPAAVQDGPRALFPMV
jgi:cell division inhibitor SepF